MRVPVLIVSGFLGSGKTTLVRRLLAHAQASGIRTAVISNEFGELGIDEALLGGGTEEFVELAGGCVCCKLSDELVDTLQRLRERVNPDQIIIETSGVALPFDTQLNLYRPPVKEWIGDEACVVVVSATQLAARETDETFEQQVGSADIVVISKIDLVPVLADLESNLRAMNPDAPLIPASFGDVDPELLFPTGPRERLPASTPHTHAAYAATELLVPDGLPIVDAEAWIRDHAGLRTKGFIRTAEGVRVVQGVARRMELLVPDVPVPDLLLNRVVVIRRVEGHHTH